MNIPEKYELYAQTLRDWSQRMNLVAPSTLDDVYGRHIADSAQLADVLPNGVRVVDLGSGAGFPAVVLAILGWDVTCVESIGKKVSFLNELKTVLNLPNLTVFHGRVEDFVKQLPKNDDGLVFTARAFASLSKILDYVRGINSRLFLLKGREIKSEIDVAKLSHRFDYELVASKTGDGFIIIVEKHR